MKKGRGSIKDLSEADKRVLDNIDELKKYMKENFDVTPENIDEKLEEARERLKELRKELNVKN